MITEFALLPYAADAPLHIAALITPTHKYATYSHWRPGTIDAVARGGRRPSSTTTRTPAGMLEIDNLAGLSADEERLRGAARGRDDRASSRRRCPFTLASAQQRGLAEYHALAAAARTAAAVHRMNTVEGSCARSRSSLP